MSSLEEGTRSPKSFEEDTMIFERNDTQAIFEEDTIIFEENDTQAIFEENEAIFELQVSSEASTNSSQSESEGDDFKHFLYLTCSEFVLTLFY